MEIYRITATDGKTANSIYVMSKMDAEAILFALQQIMKKYKVEKKVEMKAIHVLTHEDIENELDRLVNDFKNLN
jgi:hypothetical protein